MIFKQSVRPALWLMLGFTLLALGIVMAGCCSSRGLIIYRDGQPIAHAYETAQWPWVPGEFMAGLSDGPTSGTMTVRHGVLGALGLAGIAAVSGAAGGVVLP